MDEKYKKHLGTIVFNVAAVVMIIILLLLSAAGVFNGKDGKDAELPVFEMDGTYLRYKLYDSSWSSWVNLKGDRGTDGLDGFIPIIEWNGTMIHIMNPDGTWTQWVDLQGEKGETGSSGSSGRNGKDAPVNVAPTIDLVNISGYHNCYTFNATILISDPDDPIVELTVYYALDDVDPQWIQCDHQWVEPGSQYSIQKVIYQPTIHFRFVAEDGSDLATEVFNYTVI